MPRCTECGREAARGYAFCSECREEAGSHGQSKAENRAALPFYRRGWFLIALCVLFPFVGVPMIWLLNPRPFGKVGTLGLTAAGILLFAIGISSNSEITAPDESAESGTAPSEVMTTGIEGGERAKTYITPTVDVLNVRKGAPGWFRMKGEIGQVQAGDSLQVESEDDGWLEVTDARSGINLGWVHGDYVTELRPGLADSLRASMEERQRRAAQARAESEEAIRSVVAGLAPNKLSVEAGHLLTKENPRGEGRFVYVQQTRFNGVKRNVIWLVIDEQVYPLNGTTKGVTPSFPWPREAPTDVWSRTGLGLHSAAEGLKIVFG